MVDLAVQANEPYRAPSAGAPADSQIVIPEVGGTFQDDAYLENNTADDIVADLELEAVMPDGTIYPVMSFPGQNIPVPSA